MARAIVLDTETTGLDPRTGHRLIELGCVEVLDYIPTGNTFHRYIHPERDIDPEAERVHGISLAMLDGKPKFHEISEEFLKFVGDAPLVAHNAAFDRGFVNHELERCNRQVLPESRWVDTLQLAQKRFPGMYNSLDALCKRFKISLATRDKHGALIDATLLAQVYLELQGGKERSLELMTEAVVARATSAAVQAAYGARPRPLGPRSTDEERALHEAFVRDVLKDKAVWLKCGL
ncbi:MAG TPA: DNA polymerase III subunit epsilon [Caulobacteraceae bacterium]|nr:DNA polymerase III subunit epsilon [Caulobacteraceae bacterium]